MWLSCDHTHLSRRRLHKGQVHRGWHNRPLNPSLLATSRLSNKLISSKSPRHTLAKKSPPSSWKLFERSLWTVSLLIPVCIMWGRGGVWYMEVFSKYRIAGYFRGRKFHKFLQLYKNIIHEKKKKTRWAYSQLALRWSHEKNFREIHYDSYFPRK